MTVTYIREIDKTHTVTKTFPKIVTHQLPEVEEGRNTVLLLCPSVKNGNEPKRKTVSNNPLAAQKLKGEGGLESNIMTTNMREEEVVVIYTQISPGLWSKTFGFGVFTSSWLGIELE